MEFRRRSRIESPAGDAFAWHARPLALERLLPPWQRMRVLERSGGIRDGGRVVLQLGRPPLALRWLALHSGYQEGKEFRDEQVQGPFRRFVHTHRFVPDGPEACFLDDEVEYELPLGALGRALGCSAVRSTLARTFRFRHARVRRDLSRHRARGADGLQRVVISGASGLVGSALAAFLSTGGHRVARLVRRAAADASEIPWDPAKGEIGAALLEGADAVVHLAGESVAAGRWTAARRARILESRVQGTRLLSEALAQLERPPSVLISASAIGYYGDRGPAELDEDSPAGAGFLADVCRAWERASEPARAAGIRVVNLRIGMVLSAAGGALAPMLIPFRLGVGGRIGDGRQVTSWVALDDLIGAIHHALYDARLEGPVNATAPAPVDQAEFARTLGRVLRRPVLLSLPAAAARAALGEMAQEMLLGGARALPARLQEAGFSFLFPTLEQALRAELGLEQGD